MAVRLTDTMKFVISFLFVVGSVLSGCSNDSIRSGVSIPAESVTTTDVGSPEITKIIQSAESQTKVTRGYTQDYVAISYPNGDLPSGTGACTDVIIRSFRNA